MAALSDSVAKFPLVVRSVGRARTDQPVQSARCASHVSHLAAGEFLDFLVQEALGGGPGGAAGEGGQGAEGGQQGLAGVVTSVQRTLNSVSYFMRSLTK
jgi:hypothetical protein